MNNYTISRVFSTDKKEMTHIESLLQAEGIRLDDSIDYTCAIYNENKDLVATGSTFKNTLRCIAIDNSHRGEGLMNLVISHLLEKQYASNFFHTFVYTKPETSKFFKDLGFHPILEVPNQLVFLENKRNGFRNYIEHLKKETLDQLNKKQLPFNNSLSQAAIIMNANPFTKGHLALVEEASKNHDIVHLFVVSEDSSLFPFSIRENLVTLGTAHLSNVIYHRTDSYMISSATFPAYFQKSPEDVIHSQTAVDASIFIAIAKELNITHRYLGSEPTSQVTNSYNQQLCQYLPQENITVHVLNRITNNNNITISASTVRQSLKENDWTAVKTMVPITTYEFLKSPEAKPILTAIQQTDTVIHH